MRWRPVPIAAFFAALIGLEATPAAAASDTVDIRMTVAAFAEIEVPGGLGFILRVPNTPHCAPRRERDWDYWRGRGDNRKRGKNDRDDWDDWRDDDWNRWGENDGWDDWHEWNGTDWQRHGWHERCKRWLSAWYWPVVRPVRIPFAVTGNALASVSVRPHQALKIKSGRYLGKATAAGSRTIGYDIVVHFPAPRHDYHWLSGWEFYDDWLEWRRWAGFGALPGWSRWARLPVITSAGNVGRLVTPPLTANLVQRGGKAHGVIYIVSRRDLTADGKKARPGDYAGAIEITIVADNS